MIIRKTPEEIEKMRVAGRIVARVLKALEEAVIPDKTTTLDLDNLAEAMVREAGGRPSFKGYRDFPASICASVNDEVVHGIPSSRRILKTGDIVGIDLGVYLNGFHADAAISVAVGEISPEAQKLMRVTRESLYKGLEMARPGNRLGDVSHAIQRHAEKHGYGVVRELVGHGVGRELHEDPQIPNYGKAGRGPRLEPGMTLAIEPMINMGSPHIEVTPDQWTYVTKDRRLSAHFEHTVAITDKGNSILTI
ncbi:MAG: type I methionyl aminopeptidase [Armatimonadetes bacterium]|nr:type I methionyl aminopeptidase [Armatimonadota bacterium]